MRIIQWSGPAALVIYVVAEIVSLHHAMHP